MATVKKKTLAPQTSNGAQPVTTWGARRAQFKIDEKTLMAHYFASHDFLVQEDESPETQPRESVANIIVNQGTTPNTVVRYALEWIENNRRQVPPDITWYSPGHLVPTTLANFRKEYPHLLVTTQLFLFPGKVDHNSESVAGPAAEAFAENLDTQFSCAILSAYSFDVETGIVNFNAREELRLQRACATHYAAHKFLFLDASKFRKEGHIGYSIEELLLNSETVTIYTVSSPKDEQIKAKFNALSDRILSTGNDSGQLDIKTLRLRIVGTHNKTTESIEKQGFLRIPKDKPAS